MWRQGASDQPCSLAWAHASGVGHEDHWGRTDDILTLDDSCSDKTVIVWDLERGGDVYGTAKRSLQGHSHFVQDVVISSDGQFCLTGSWDGTLRLWDLNTGSTTRELLPTRQFVGPMLLRPGPLIGQNGLVKVP